MVMIVTMMVVVHNDDWSSLRFIMILVLQLFMVSWSGGRWLLMMSMIWGWLFMIVMVRS